MDEVKHRHTHEKRKERGTGGLDKIAEMQKVRFSAASPVKSFSSDSYNAQCSIVQAMKWSNSLKGKCRNSDKVNLTNGQREMREFAASRPTTEAFLSVD